MKHYFWESSLSLALCFLIFSDGLLPAAFAQDAPARIEIVVVDGEGVTNGLNQRASRDPLVRIEDDDHRPVAGAVVVFALPVSGTTGQFTNGAKSLTVVTDKSGQAAAPGLRTNEVPGKLQIYVTASYRGLRARALINQLVEPPPGFKAPPPAVRTASSGGKWKWLVLGIAAAGGAGAGIYFGTHNSGSSSSSASSISISIGTVGFGSPR
jgi:hypothetical protein